MHKYALLEENIYQVVDDHSDDIRKLKREQRIKKYRYLISLTIVLAFILIICSIIFLYRAFDLYAKNMYVWNRIYDSVCGNSSCGGR